jgi:hypothetical protein
MPKPVILFTWDGWWTDMECSFLGPSSLFQRWNLHIRHNYGLLNKPAGHPPSNGNLQVLLILRRMNSWRLKVSSGRSDMNMMTSRLMLNEADVIRALGSLKFVNLVAVDLAEFSYEQQVGIMANSSIVIGAHGAGMAATTHMPIGSAACCGVIEIFPPGPFLPIRGYGNMARRMGHYYERMEIKGSDNVPNKGMIINTDELITILNGIVDKIRDRPTCVHPDVVNNPLYFV